MNKSKLNILVGIIIIILGFSFAKPLLALTREDEEFGNDDAFDRAKNSLYLTAEDSYDTKTYESRYGILALIGQGTRMVFSLLGVMLVIIFIYAGFLWMTAGGDTEQIDKAKKWMRNAVLGLLLILCSYLISTYIISFMNTSLIG